MKLSNIIESASVFTAKKDIRYYMNVPCFYFMDNTLVSVCSTDGHILLKTTINGDVRLRDCTQLIFPENEVKKIIAVLGDYDTDNAISIELFKQFENYNPNDVRFPDIDRVIPSDNRPVDLSRGIGINISFLSRIDKFTSKLIKGIKLKPFDKTLLHNYHFYFAGCNESILIEQYNKLFSGINYQFVVMPVRI